MFQLYLYALAPEHSGAVLDELRDRGLSIHERMVLLGRQYHHSYGGGRYDEPVEVGHRLHELAPTAVFTAWVDPDGEGLGQGVIGTADGVWTFTCGSDGDPMFTASELTQLARERPGASVHELTGGQWTTALHTAMQLLAEDEVVVQVPACTVCGGPRQCAPDPCDLPGCALLDCQEHYACEVEKAQEDAAHAINELVTRGVLALPSS